MGLGVVLVGTVSQETATRIESIVVFKQRVVEPGALQQQVLDGVGAFWFALDGRGEIDDFAE